MHEAQRFTASCLRGGTALESAAELTLRMDMGGAQDMDKDEFCEYLHMALHSLDTESQHALLRSTMWARFMSLKAPEAQFGYAPAKCSSTAHSTRSRPVVRLDLSGPRSAVTTT